MEEEIKSPEEEITPVELFNESDSSDLRDICYIIDVDNDGKTIISHEPTIPFEELHCAEYDKFLVPLFIFKGDESSFIGNGVIVDKYLITAAHVVVCDKCKRNLSQICYRIDKDFFEVNDDMLIHDGRDFYGRVVPDKNDIHDDLMVYELNKNYNSFKLSEESVGIGEDLAIISYIRNPDDKDKTLPKKTVCKVSLTNKGRFKKQILDRKNCFIVNNQWFFQPGNSGSALFNKEIMYGILITANRNGFGSIGTAIEARYIKDVIDKYKANNK